jgi:hypothetical protein
MKGKAVALGEILEGESFVREEGRSGLSLTEVFV